MQTKTMSLIETITNIVVGYLIALGVQLLIFPPLGVHLDLHQNIAIALVFTVASILRSYVLRRVFNRLAIRKGHQGRRMSCAEVAP